MFTVIHVHGFFFFFVGGEDLGFELKNLVVNKP